MGKGLTETETAKDREGVKHCMSDSWNQVASTLIVSTVRAVKVNLPNRFNSVATAL